MSPSCVLLDEVARLVADTEAGPMTAEEIARGRSTEEASLFNWVEEGNVRLVVNGPVKPPDMFTVSLHLPASPLEISSQLQGVQVVSVVKNLMVLSTGPRFDVFPGSGELMVYNADTGALMLAPMICWGVFRQIFVNRRVVLQQIGSSDFRLIMLLVCRRTMKPFVLDWRSSFSGSSSKCSLGQGQWQEREVRLPEDIANYPFSIDKAFYFSDRWACLVDLDRGIIMCDMLSTNLDCDFVPLPEKYRETSFPMERGRPDEFSTVDVSNGEIKLLFMEDFVKPEVPRDQVTVSTFTLCVTVDFPHGRSEWRRNEETSFQLGDLLTDESFLAISALPKCAPIFPVLSPQEPNMAYFFISDMVIEESSVMINGKYVLGVNMKAKKVQLWSKCPDEGTHVFFRSCIAAEFGAFLQSSNLNDQGNQEAQKRQKLK